MDVGYAFEKAYICDLCENVVRELAVKNGKIALSFKPFEILTVKII